MQVFNDYWWVILVTIGCALVLSIVGRLIPDNPDYEPPKGKINSTALSGAFIFIAGPWAGIMLPYIDRSWEETGPTLEWLSLSILVVCVGLNVMGAFAEMIGVGQQEGTWPSKLDGRSGAKWGALRALYYVLITVEVVSAGFFVTILMRRHG